MYTRRFERAMLYGSRFGSETNAPVLVAAAPALEVELRVELELAAEPDSDPDPKILTLPPEYG